MDSAAGESSAAPSPPARKPIREPSDQASPSSSELAVKSANPAMNRRRRPSRSSAMRPPRRRRERDRRGHHPLQVLLAEAEVCLRRGKRDVDDRRVEHHHELCGDDHRQREPARRSGWFSVIECRGACNSTSFSWFLLGRVLVAVSGRYGVPASAGAAFTNSCRGAWAAAKLSAVPGLAETRPHCRTGTPWLPHSATEPDPSGASMGRVCSAGHGGGGRAAARR